MRTKGVFLLAALWGCGGLSTSGGGGDMRLTVEPTPAAAGDTMEILLENASDVRVGYNLCTSSLERRSDGAWTNVPSERICTMELRTLAPGETARFPLPLEAGLQPGEYRVVTTVEILDAGERRDVATEPFRIR